MYPAILVLFLSHPNRVQRVHDIILDGGGRRGQGIVFQRHFRHESRDGLLLVRGQCAWHGAWHGAKHGAWQGAWFAPILLASASSFRWHVSRFFVSGNNFWDVPNFAWVAPSL